jgi:hypothetical protein
MAKKSERRIVVIEVPLSDGWRSMYVGQFVSRDAVEIILDHPCFVKNTGRRHKFFSGAPDSEAEWEPSGPRASFPSEGAILTEWPHPFKPFLEAR